MRKLEQRVYEMEGETFVYVGIGDDRRLAGRRDTHENEAKNEVTSSHGIGRARLNEEALASPLDSIDDGNAAEDRNLDLNKA